MLGLDCGQRVAEFDQIVVLVQPLIKYGKLLDYLLLNLIFHILFVN